MAISGCELICDNKDCKCVGTGIVMTATWPLGDIDLVIETGKDNKDYYEGMKKLKENGRKYACITMPNKANIPTLGYRIQTWCDQCNSMGLHDAIINSPDESMEETIAKAQISELCSFCNTRIRQFSHVVLDGIDCLCCKRKLKTKMWFVNEKE